MYRRLAVAVPMLVLFFLVMFGGTAAAQTPQDTITPTLAITASVQAPAEVVFTQPYSYSLLISNSGELSTSVEGKIDLYYSRIVSFTADVTLTTQITTPNPYDTSASFSLEQEVEPGQVVTITVYCDQDYTGPVWSEVTITATSPATNSGMALFLEDTWQSIEPYDLAIQTRLAPSGIISGDIVSLQVVLSSGRLITETRGGVALTGFNVLDWTVDGEEYPWPNSPGSSVQIAKLTAVQAAEQNELNATALAQWRATAHERSTHLARFAVKYPELAMAAAAANEEPIFISLTEGDPFFFWTPSSTPQEITIDFRLRFADDAEPSINSFITGQFFPAGQEWKYDKSTADNEVSLKPGQGFEIVVGRDYLPYIVR